MVIPKLASSLSVLIRSNGPCQCGTTCQGLQTAPFSQARPWELHSFIMEGAPDVGLCLSSLFNRSLIDRIQSRLIIPERGVVHDSHGIGTQLVTLCQSGKNQEAIDRLYSPHITSVEAMAMPNIGQTQTGIEAINSKNIMNDGHAAQAHRS